MRNTAFGRGLSSLIWLAALLLVAAPGNPLGAQTPTDTARVVLVNLTTAGSSTDLSEAALREVQVTLDSLRASSHIRLVPRRDIDNQLRGAGFPMSLSLTADMTLLQRILAADAILGVTVETRPNGYRLLTTLVGAFPNVTPIIRAPIEGYTISAVAQSLARQVASDSSIRRVRR